MQELKDRVKIARRNANLTQVELAKAVNRLTKREGPGVEKEKFTQVQVSDLERGKTNRSSYLPHIAVACGVSAAWLAFGIGPSETKYDVHGGNEEDEGDPVGLTAREVKVLRALLEKADKAATA